MLDFKLILKIIIIYVIVKNLFSIGNCNIFNAFLSISLDIKPYFFYTFFMIINNRTNQKNYYSLYYFLF